MNLIPQSKFKDLIGISKQAVSQLVQNGTVTSVKKGRYKQIDLDGALTQQYMSEKQDKQSEPNAPVDFAAPVSEKRSLENEKLREQIAAIRLKTGIDRGDLVSKKLIKKVFDRLYAIDQQQLKPLGVNVSPKISAVYNIGNTEKALQILELFKADDQEKKAEISQILNSGEPDRINEMNQIIEDATGSVLENVQREIVKFLESIDKGEGDGVVGN